MTNTKNITGAARTSRRWIGLALGTVGVAAAGTAAGLLQPLGPTTPAGALALMAGGLSVGLVAGALARTRWMSLLAPLAFVVAFELTRSGAGLLTTGPLRLESAYGPLAWALGRLVPWALAVISLATGAGWGVRAAQRRPGGSSGLVVATALTVLLAGSLLLPASSPALRDPSGTPIPGAVSELVSVELGGHEQWIQVRGASANLPVLLYLSGGPGQSDLPFSRVLFEPLTRDFLVVGWDQRGTGKSYTGIDAGLTLDRMVEDTIELARTLAERYGQPKIYLLGESWGSILGVLAVQRAPELFHAYLGSGQMVDPLATDEAIYRDLVTTAMRSGNGDLVASLAKMGRPPYRGGTIDYGFIFSHYSLIEGGYTPPQEYVQRGSDANLGPWGVLGQEYAPLEKISVLRGLMDLHSVMYPQLQHVDFRHDATSLDVPVYLIMGEHELAARTAPAKEWFELLRAPDKRWYSLPDSGHSVAFEQAGELHRILLQDVHAGR